MWDERFAYFCNIVQIQSFLWILHTYISNVCTLKLPWLLFGSSVIEGYINSRAGSNHANMVYEK